MPPRPKQQRQLWQRPTFLEAVHKIPSRRLSTIRMDKLLLRFLVHKFPFRRQSTIQMHKQLRVRRCMTRRLVTIHLTTRTNQSARRSTMAIATTKPTRAHTGSVWCALSPISERKPIAKVAGVLSPPAYYSAPPLRRQAWLKFLKTQSNR